MRDSLSANWHSDKCFAPVLRLPSTHQCPHCLSSNIILAMSNGASPSRSSQGGLVQWQDNNNKKRSRCQASTGNNAVVTELLSTTRSCVCLRSGRLSHQQASKTHQKRVCVSLNRWHISRRTPSQTFFQVPTMETPRMRESLCISTREKELKQLQSWG